MNLGLPDLVCDHMMDKAMNNINCGEVSDRQLLLSEYDSAKITTSISKYQSEFENGFGNDTVESTTTPEFNRSNHDFEMEVCRAERQSQKLGSTISAYIAPFGNYFQLQKMKTVYPPIHLFHVDSVIGIVLVLFAGSWSDKSGRRKPCILIPQIGEALAQLGEKMNANQIDDNSFV